MVEALGGRAERLYLRQSRARPLFARDRKGTQYTFIPRVNVQPLLIWGDGQALRALFVVPWAWDSPVVFLRRGDGVEVIVSRCLKNPYSVGLDDRIWEFTIEDRVDTQVT